MTLAGSDVIPLGIRLLGWTGQACFFLRFLVQWRASERARRSTTPAIFWAFSIAGAAISLVYAYLGESHSLVFVSQYAITLVIYGRNVALAARPEGGRRLSGRVTLAITLVLLLTLAVLYRLDPAGIEKLRPDDPAAWFVVGAVGTFLAIARFVVQWMIAERTGRAALTPAFFWISLPGSLLLLVYAIHKGDAPFIAGQVPNSIVYTRNLVLAYRARGSGTSLPPPALDPPPPPA